MANMEDKESLFSLELVVEKVYIPNNTTCRFPSIAFRLLDFPTIMIDHVEKELSTVIRRKISLDPYYQTPGQFSELKDRHGNFMVKKGKSCLFKMEADILKQHLTSTPLYVMVVDMFPEVPKLIGNSTVPLDSLMENISNDIAKLGISIPSVHGDKGLFKVFSLMGKEIGYFVLGIRLVYLGPSLLSHLPASSLMQRHGQSKKSNNVIEKMLNYDNAHEDELDETYVELKNSACMTEPMKEDMMLQTIDVKNKAVGVEIDGIDNKDRDEVDQSYITKPNILASVATQTQKQGKIKEALDVQQKWVEKLEHKTDDDEIIVNNIICPPPLFYNSDATPNVQIKRQIEIQPAYNLSVDDLSDIESFDGYGINVSKPLTRQPKDPNLTKNQSQEYNVKNDHFKQVHQGNKNSQNAEARTGELIQDLNVGSQAKAIFPILTALINELSCVQNPQLLVDAKQRLQTNTQQIYIEREEKNLGNSKLERNDKISPDIVAAVAKALGKKMDNSKENIPHNVRNIPDKFSSMTSTKKTKNSKSKNTTSSLSKKTPLSFGLTNTQRLRLQKTNPEWLKKIEEDLQKNINKEQKTKAKSNPLDELNATTFSDTLTEVRRLAEKELESTVGGDTLRHLASEAEEFNSTKESHERSLEIQKACSGQSKNKNREPPQNHKVHPRPNSRNIIRKRRENKNKELQDSSDSDTISKKKPVPVERQLRNITSPSIPEQDADDVLSARSDLTSRSRSIEVRLPSAQVDPNDSEDLTDTDDDINIPLPDESFNSGSRAQSVNLPQYISREESLPEPITGKVNESLGSGIIDDSSPMESTRQSKNMTEEQNQSRVPTEDSYTRQFHSTDEPELLGLVSDEENISGNVSATGGSTRRSMASLRTSQKFPVINPQVSENSPVPSVRRSTTKLDAGALSYLPNVSDSKGHRSPMSRSHGSRSPASRGSPVSSRPGTPTKGSNKGLEPLNPKGGIVTPRNIKSQRSISPATKRLTPRLHKKSFTRESIHTESVSSFMPSDPENVMVSLSSNSGVYSDDFQDSIEANSSVEQLPKIGIVPNKKLGYTIN